MQIPPVRELILDDDVRARAEALAPSHLDRFRDGLQRILPGQRVNPRPGRIPPPTAAEPPVLAPQAAPASVATPVETTRGAR